MYHSVTASSRRDQLDIRNPDEPRLKCCSEELKAGMTIVDLGAARSSR